MGRNACPHFLSANNEKMSSDDPTGLLNFGAAQPEKKEKNIFELPFKPPDWAGSLGFFLPLPSPKPKEIRAVEFLEAPELAASEKPQDAWSELVDLLGSGGASSRAVSERLHKTRSAGAAGADQDEEEDAVISGSAADNEARKLKKELAKFQAKMADFEKRLMRESAEKDRALMEKKGLEAQVSRMKEDIELLSSMPRMSTARSSGDLMSDPVKALEKLGSNKKRIA